MADEELSGEAEGEAPAKKSKMPMIIGLVLALAGAGGGFFAVSSGLILATDAPMDEKIIEEPILVEPLNGIAFIPLDPLIINLRQGSQAAHLRFVAHLEVDQRYESDVNLLMPRILDVLNNYLRAINLDDVEKSGALIQLRAQMLRRVQIVTGDGRVKDLLVSEFVLN